MLTGQAKTDYQREYMRKRRSNRSNANKVKSVRPEQRVTVRPHEPRLTKLKRPPGISNNQWAYMQYKAEEKERVDKAEDAAGLVSKP